MRRLHVSHEVILPEVGFITDTTLKGFEAHMLQGMPLKIWALSEIGITVGTTIGHVSVDGVSLQVTQRVKRIVALVA